LLVDDGALEVAKAAYLAFFTKNNSDPRVPGAEHELVSLVLDLFHGALRRSGA
jgi:hypothetical protein